MHQLTLSFRDRKQRVYQLKGEQSTAGRDSGCDIVIDSLAIEPVHAHFVIQDDQLTVSPATPQATILLNGKEIQEQQLTHGDQISLGKHTLTYSKKEYAERPQESGTDQGRVTHKGWLQFTNGPKVGHSIPINKRLMRIGKSRDCLALISTRDGGFYISHLDGEQPTRIDGVDLEDRSHLLNDGDSIQLGKIRMLFFTDNPE